MTFSDKGCTVKVTDWSVIQGENHAPRPDVSTERKNQILNAAMRVFARRGFHKARMDDIAAESHLSKGALYLYFRSKDAIIQALARKLFDVELRALRRAASERRPAPHLPARSPLTAKQGYTKSLLPLSPRSSRAASAAESRPACKSSKMRRRSSGEGCFPPLSPAG